MLNKIYTFFSVDKSTLWRIVVAALAVTAILGLHLLARELFPHYRPMSLFLTSVVVAGWLGGLRTGIAATLLGGWIELWVFESALEKPMEMQTIRLVIFLLQGLIISYVFGEVHTIHKKILENDARLAHALESEQKGRQLADEANKIKSLFLANMSHEIRTPLNAIIGYAELLRENETTSRERARYVDIIERSGVALKKLIDDVLDLSKIEAGHLEIESIPFSLSNLLNEVQSVFQLRCEEKNIQLSVLKVTPTPDFVKGDPTRLRQILINIVGNAVKFTSKGSIRIEYGVHDKELFFRVHDTGIGMTKEQSERLFRSFCQGDQTISRRYAGTGLGLSLSKQLAKKLSGDVVIEKTEPGRGSTFLVTVKFEKAPALAAQDQARKDSIDKTAVFKDKRILLVDDSNDNLFLLTRILSKLGFTVEAVHNGLEAVEAVDEKKYDLILMDMQMPVMDGYSASRAIHERHEEIPVIALTANAMKEDRDRCLQSGCKGFVSKPVQRTDLVEILRKTLTDSGTQAS